MCGIFGWSFKKKSKIPAAQRQAFASVLSIGNSARGSDSWGVYLVNGSGQKGEIYKDKGSIVGIPTAQWGMRNVAMGHTRYATVGDKTKRNAHPFQEKNIILAHNGAVYNHKELGEKYKRKYECDSEHLVMHMAEDLPMKEIEGYGAIEWVEVEKPESVFLSRISYSGNLAMTKILIGTEQVGTAWSSDKNHLKAALESARLNWELYQEGMTGEIFEAINGVLYTTTRPKIEISLASMGGRGNVGGGYYGSGGGYLYGDGWERSKSGTHYRHSGRTPIFSRSPDQSIPLVTIQKPNDYDKKSGEVVIEDHWIKILTKDDTRIWVRSFSDLEKMFREEKKEEKKEEETPSQAIILQHPTASKMDKDDEHHFLGLSKQPDGSWTNARGEIVDVDKIFVDDEAEEDEHIRQWFLEHGWRLGSDGKLVQEEPPKTSEATDANRGAGNAA